MTELAIPTTNTGELLVSNGTVDIDLHAWAERMTSAAHIAKALASTPFVPASLRVWTRKPDYKSGFPGELDIPGTTATVAAALLTGTEVGMPPMAALRSIDIIDGTPAMRALAQRALILRAGHAIWVVESSTTRAIVTGMRAGTNRQQTSTWTKDRARDARLLDKKNWQTHPGAMLIARATAEVARWIAPEVLLGLPYALEELQDGPEGEPADVDDSAPQAGPAPRRTAQRRTRRAITPPPTPAAAETVSEPRPPTPPAATAPGSDDPPFDMPTATAPPEDLTASDTGGTIDHDQDDVSQAMNTAQNRKMHALFRDLQVTGRGDRLAFVRDVIDRDIESSTELTMDEASMVIDTLTRALDAGEVEPE